MKYEKNNSRLTISMENKIKLTICAV